MALFFDLSVPYLENRPNLAAGELKTLKDARLKSVVRAMELGYAAVAFDRPFKGVLSDSDRCSICPFRLQSLLAAAPAIAAAAAFHRVLVGAPLSSPFRQYSRLTVSVDSAAAAAALNAGNTLLRTYDLVAARPMNQLAFDHVCKVSEVDIIAFNFSQKLPFRLKLPMVKAAIERGVYFEITYSHLIVDVHLRKYMPSEGRHMVPDARQMLSDAKLLVEWTRGKNLIISSAASTVGEIRGPYDVANLSGFLLGLSMERAKAAISGNCRSMVANALKKKHCYKQAIRIERILPDEQLDSNRSWFVGLDDWDPISSGEGDLPPLDGITKFLSTTSELPKGSSAIDFTSIIDQSKSSNRAYREDNPILPSHSAKPFSFPRDLGSYTSALDVPYNSNVTQQNILIDLPVERRTLVAAPPLAEQISESDYEWNLRSQTAACEVPSCNNNVTQKDMLIRVPVDRSTSISMTPLAERMPDYERDLVSPFGNAKEPAPTTTRSQVPRTANVYNMVSGAAENPSSITIFKKCNVIGEVNPIAADADLMSSFIEGIKPCLEDSKNSEGVDVVSPEVESQKDTELVDCIPSDAGDKILLDNNEKFLSVEPSSICMEDCKPSEGPDMVSDVVETQKDVTELVDCIHSNECDQILLNSDDKVFSIPEETDMLIENVTAIQTLSVNSVLLQRDFSKPPPSEQEVSLPLPDDILMKNAFDETNEQKLRKNDLVETCVPFGEGLVRIEEKRQDGSFASDGAEHYKSKSGRVRRKAKSSHPSYPWPFKGLFKPVLFKRVRQIRRPSKHL